MLRPEPLNLVIIFVVAMLLFGTKRLPESARAIAQAIREFRDAVTGSDAAAKTDDAKDTRHTNNQT